MRERSWRTVSASYYAIMAFSAKASKARPRLHNPSVFMRVGRLLAQRPMAMLCLFNLAGVNESAPGASVLSRR